MAKRGKHQRKAERRRAALREAAAAAAPPSAAPPPAAALPPAAGAAPISTPQPITEPIATPQPLTEPIATTQPLTEPIATPQPAAGRPPERRRRAGAWPIIGVAAAGIVGIAIFAALTLGGGDEPDGQAARPTIEVGMPGGEVISQATPTPRLPEATPSATPAPTPEPTPGPTPEQATPVPTPVPATPAPTTAPTPPPATAAPATPAPTAIVVAAASPADAVAAFYGNVVSGSFDAAYSLWSDRMRATYPRTANLDERFDETASITFHQLNVAEQTADRATVQANFTETYDSGSSRQFVGYWRLVLVDGRWLLDEPHY